jgi:hypothetical protein
MFNFFLPEKYVAGNEGALRLSAAFACSISIPLVFKLAARLCEYRMAWLLTILWAMNPFAIEWSRQYAPYTNMPVWSMLLILATFGLASSIKSQSITNKDWVFFHFSMILSMTSNLFNFLVAIALFPHLLSIILLTHKGKMDRARLLVSAYGPHLIPGALIALGGLKEGMDPSKNDNSWMPSASWSSPFELIEMTFPEPAKFGALAILFLLMTRFMQSLRTGIGASDRVSVLTVLGLEGSALFLAGTLQLFCFLVLQLLGSPSWVTRYMLHLIPIWLILIGMYIAPKNSTDQRGDILGRSLPTVGQFGTVVVFLLAISTAISIGPAPDMRTEDVRGAWEVVADDYNSSENQVFLTHPTDYFYVYYVEMFSLEPDEFVGSWQDISEERLDEIIDTNPDSIHRVRLGSHDDSSLNEILSEHYFLEKSSEPRGMVVEHWVRK